MPYKTMHIVLFACYVINAQMTWIRSCIILRIMVCISACLTTLMKILVRAECVGQRNEVAIKLGIIQYNPNEPGIYVTPINREYNPNELSSFLSSAQNPRRGCRRILNFYMGF